MDKVARCAAHYLADEGGRCGVWKHRASVCATWYCKYVRGATGQKFWQSLHQLFTAIELRLSRWCVHRLDPGSEALKLLFASQNENGLNNVDPRALDGEPDPKRQRELWGNWAGRETDYYKACACLVEALSWPEVLAVCGQDIRINARLVTESYQQLISSELPGALRVGSFRCLSPKADSQVVSSYNGYDPIELPRQLLDVLPRFDGRPTRQVLATISAEHGIKLDQALVRRLVDFRILIPAATPSGGS